MSEDKKKVGSIIRVLISFVFLGGLIFILRDELPQVWQTVRYADPRLLLLAFFLFFVPYFYFCVLRLQLVFIVQKVRLSIRYIYFLRFIGFFFNNFLPSAVGGDLVSAYLATKRTGKGVESFTAVFIDRLVGFFTIFFLALIALFINHEQIAIPHFQSILIGLILFMALQPLFYFSKRVARPFRFLVAWLPKGAFEKIKAAYHAIYQYRHHPIALINITLISFMFQAVAMYVNYVCARALGMPISIWDCFFLIPLVWVASMIPSLGGLGVREGAYVLFFKNFGGSEKAFALSLLYYSFTICASLIGGICYLFAGKIPQGALEKMEEEDLKKLEEVPLV